MLADVPSERLSTPNFGRIAQILWLRARHMYHPRFGVVADDWFLGAVVAVFQGCHRADRESLGHPFGNAQARHPETPPNAGYALSCVISQNYRGTLRLPMRHCARPRYLLQFGPVFIRQDQLGSSRFTCHA